MGDEWLPFREGVSDDDRERWIEYQREDPTGLFDGNEDLEPGIEALFELSIGLQATSQTCEFTECGTLPGSSRLELTAFGQYDELFGTIDLETFIERSVKSRLNGEHLVNCLTDFGDGLRSLRDCIDRMIELCPPIRVLAPGND